MSAAEGNVVIEVVVRKKHLEARDVFLFELAPSTAGSLPPFAAGAHIDVQVRPNLVRQYSLCNPSHEDHRYLIGVLREETSRGGSVAMHDEISEGDVMLISEPKNHFPLVKGDRYLLIAGGIGITPILCMAEQLSDTDASFEMHYCARSCDRMAFRDRIINGAFADRVSLHADDGPVEQRFDLPAILSRPGNAFEENAHVYVCGPPGFISYVKNTVLAAGWPSESVHIEHFGAAPQVSHQDHAFDVKIASTGQVFNVPENQSVTLALAAHGIEIPTSCEQGVCGTCITRVLEGQPDHRDLYLTDEERGLNNQFTPCCSRSKTGLLVLDL